MSRQNNIPVTIITGFLGAGKTTFINYLLKQNPHTCFALVENEFGDVAIDLKLIKGVDASQMFELKQGCICCSLSDEYELVLQELAERFPDVEHLLIETTGIADPAPVIQPLFRDENLRNIYRYNGTICLIDAVNFESQPEKEINLKQLVVADLVLLNKSEKLSDGEREKLQNTLQKINPLAHIQCSTFGEADVHLETIQTKIRNLFDFVSYSSLHAHIQAKTLRFDLPLNKTEFFSWLAYSLDIYKKQIYRCKGVVCFRNEPFNYILQGVGGSFELEDGELILEETRSEVVFIGKLEGVSLEFNGAL